MRDSLLTWTRAEREAVYAYVGRQYTPEVQQWLELRATVLRQQWPDQKELRLWHEAAADLIAWQRQISAEQVLPWLAEWEATATQSMETTK